MFCNLLSFCFLDSIFVTSSTALANQLVPVELRHTHTKVKTLMNIEVQRELPGAVTL